MRELLEENEDLQRECGMLSERCEALEDRCQSPVAAMGNPQADEPSSSALDEPRLAGVVRSVLTGIRREQREVRAKVTELEEQSWVEAQTCKAELHHAQGTLEEVHRRNAELERQLSSSHVEAQRAELRRDAAEREALRLREELRATQCSAALRSGRPSLEGGAPGLVGSALPLAGEGEVEALPAEGPAAGAPSDNLGQQLERLTRWRRRTSGERPSILLAGPSAGGGSGGGTGGAGGAGSACGLGAQRASCFCQSFRCLAFLHRGAPASEGASGPSSRRPSFGG
uniref:Uncharacterized protein n=1 Tax=Alexandrium catenella TaxID=2925 RepID=A0A7S1KZQ0_ALECA